jgi:trehalose utilization protein
MNGTTCNLKWRDGAKERVWTVKPNHPIAAGIPETFVLEDEEMYGEPFDIAEPDEVVFMAWFNGGEVFRTGCTWVRGNGKIFYFQPGHETFPTYHVPEVQTVLRNAVRFVAPTYREFTACPHVRKVTDEEPYVIS